jgi:hypothetical protein
MVRSPGGVTVMWAGLVDVFKGKVLFAGVSQITFHVPGEETRCLYVGDGGDFTAFMEYP